MTKNVKVINVMVGNSYLSQTDGIAERLKKIEGVLAVKKLSENPTSILAGMISAVVEVGFDNASIKKKIGEIDAVSDEAQMVALDKESLSGYSWN